MGLRICDCIFYLQDSVRNVVSRARSCECLRRVQNRLGNSCPFTQPNFFIATTGTAYAAATANTNANIVSSIVSDGDDSKHTVERDVETELLSTQTARNASELGSGVHIGVVNTPDDMLALMHREGLKFPIICKPVEACGTARSHSMLVVVSPEGLSLVEPPCVVQQYRDHDAFFYKVIFHSHRRTGSNGMTAVRSLPSELLPPRVVIAHNHPTATAVQYYFSIVGTNLINLFLCCFNLSLSVRST
jgi:hypothetical protein